jgi:indolepyruvate ferredoxin oxidoreductase
VSAGAKTIGLMKMGRTKGVVNAHEIITGDFTRDTEFQLPVEQLKLSLAARLRDDVHLFDATELAKATMGDSIYSNMMVFGAAWQMGAIPITAASIREAIALNGAAVDRNLRAFDLGRWAVLHPDQAGRLLAPSVVALPKSLDEKIAFRETHLTAYQGKRLAKRYRAMVDRFDDPALKKAVAMGYHKLLAYKDEYEVARLLQDSEAKAREAFDGDLKISYHLAPPMLSKDGADGRPMKRTFSAGMGRMFPWLARLKVLRGTPFDPFGYTTERRMERALIAQYEGDMAALGKAASHNADAAIALAALPLTIRGFGPVKAANAAKAEKEREVLLSRLRAGPSQIAAE